MLINSTNINDCATNNDSISQIQIQDYICDDTLDVKIKQI